jgi:hypothetical protein
VSDYDHGSTAVVQGGDAVTMWSTNLSPIEPASASAVNAEVQSTFFVGREPRHLSYGEVALRDEVGKLDPTRDRGHQLYVAALKMGNLVGGSELTYARASTALAAAGSALGLQGRECHATWNEALGRG